MKIQTKGKRLQNYQANLKRTKCLEMGKYKNGNFKAQWINRVIKEEEPLNKLGKRTEEIKAKKMEYMEDKRHRR